MWSCLTGKTRIVLHYSETGQQLNYLQRPASLLQLASNSEADLAALLRLVYEHQDRNGTTRRPEVKAGIMFRDVRNGQVVLNDSFLVHPELFPPQPGAAAPTECSLAAWRRERP